MQKRCWLLVVLVLFVSCGRQKITNEKDFFRWMNSEENHLMVVKKVKPVVLTVKYLPPVFLSIKELGVNSIKAVRDSLTAKYSQSRTFILTIGLEQLDTGKPSGDIMYFNVADEAQYNKRLQDLTFNFCSYIELKTDKNTYTPVLHVFENTYGISNSRTIYMVFGKKVSNDDLLTSDSYDLIFNDLLFQTGISHFKFSRVEIDEIPEISF